MTHLEKFMPKIGENYYDNTEEQIFSNKERQDMDLVKTLIHDEKAYNEFLTNILIYITGVVKLDKMNRSDDARSMYEGVVTCSDEAYGLLMLDDKSVLWRQVLKNRRASSSGDGAVPLGVKKEVSISDPFGDKYTLYSNGGVFSPNEKKGWSDEGMERYNYYYTLIQEFRESEEGKAAMVKQRNCWTKSPLFPNKKRKMGDDSGASSSLTTRIKVRCMQATWT